MSGGPVLSKQPDWDPLVRLTHWGIAFAVVVNGLFLDGGKLLHVWVGYAAAGLLALRLLWGLVGVGPARFASFPPSLARARDHVAALHRGEEESFSSHNPLGALMAYGLWAMLAIVAATGIIMAADPFPDTAAVAYSAATDHGADDRDDDEHRDDDHEESAAQEGLEEIHELAANLLLGLALVHVGGIMFESRRSGRNLIGAMAWGRPKSRHP